MKLETDQYPNQKNLQKRQEKYYQSEYYQKKKEREAESLLKGEGEKSHDGDEQNQENEPQSINPVVEILGRTVAKSASNQ